MTFVHDRWLRQGYISSSRILCYDLSERCNKAVPSSSPSQSSKLFKPAAARDICNHASHSLRLTACSSRVCFCNRHTYTGSPAAIQLEPHVSSTSSYCSSHLLPFEDMLTNKKRQLNIGSFSDCSKPRATPLSQDPAMLVK